MSTDNVIITNYTSAACDTLNECKTAMQGDTELTSFRKTCMQKRIAKSKVILRKQNATAS